MEYGARPMNFITPSKEANLKKVLSILVLAILMNSAGMSWVTANPGPNHGVSVTCESELGLPFIIEAFNVSHTDIGKTVSSIVKGCLAGGGKILSIGVFHP